MAGKINSIIEISHKYGSDANYVLAGGGNTSFKTSDVIYVKGSGSSLATLSEENMVAMCRKALNDIWSKTYSEDTDEREAQVLADMMNSRLKGEENKRPSVETLLHNLFPQVYVLHVHPAAVNALTCSKDGKKIVKDMFPDAVWVGETEPGYVLASLCRKELAAFEKRNKKKADLVFLQNHGIFFAADSKKEMDGLVSSVMKKINSSIKIKPDFKEINTDTALATIVAPQLRMLYCSCGCAKVKFTANKTILKFAASKKAFAQLVNPLTPDHIVYCKAEPLYVEYKDFESLKKDFDSYVARRGFKPKVVFVKDLGMFTLGDSVKESTVARDVFTDAMKITVMAENFGGVSHMKPSLVDFIVNWEVEKYRSGVSLSSSNDKKLTGKVAIVTGSAQGFGQGIAKYLAKEGANVVIADMNYDGAQNTAVEIEKEFGIATLAVSVNVSDEESVKNMVEKTTMFFGGIDIFVNNAGIVRAGSLEEMTKNNFELVTAVNYTAYFLCTKYVSAVMKSQRIAAPRYMADIVEINSKSGLAGSNKNFAYAGSKFGGLGLTQSFALELAPYGIKVNAVCPGNFLNGPLWSDPVRGLFVQYLNAGKVPGAKTVADVKAFYESKVPLGRGCEIEDVAKAVLYIIDQKYETGQAVPVTGGQEMLN